jgi:hypothetical protein
MIRYPLLFLLLLTAVPSLCSAEGGTWSAGEINPLPDGSRAIPDEYGNSTFETLAPSGKLKIIQRPEEHGWIMEVEFTNAAFPPARLKGEEGFPALFYLSPDERWLFEIRKDGSGSNDAHLYKLQKHRLQRTEDSFTKLSFAYLEKQFGFDEADHYHTGFAFKSWDMAKMSLKFTLVGNTSSTHIPLNQCLVFHLDTLTVTTQ